MHKKDDVLAHPSGRNPWEDIYRKKEHTNHGLDKPDTELKKIILFLKRKKCKCVLDIGCGSGRHLALLARAGFEVYGLDSSKSGMSIARAELKRLGLNAHLCVADAFSTLPFKNNFFDAVISTRVLEHSDEKGIKRCISEINRVMKPGSVLFVTLPARISYNRVRECLVRTARKIAPHTYIPTKGDEKGLVHFIYNRKMLKKHFSIFKINKVWKDRAGYFCIICEKKD